MFLYESLVQAEKIILFESYMDLEKLYGDALNGMNPNELKYAYDMVQTNKEIKNLIKKNLNLGLGGLEKAIVTKYPSPVDFVNSVFQAKDNLEKNKAAQAQKSEDQLKRQNELKENETEDFYIIPCRTFEQAHKAAFSHTGNLLLMSNQKIKETYHIDVPEPAHFYRTDKSPEEMLEFMKQAPFFMNPTWCVAANKGYWEQYDLTTESGPCFCYIIISKQHPNVRFCITKEYRTEYSPDDKIVENIIFEKAVVTAGEFRDPWQAGGDDVLLYGKRMFNNINQININTRNKIIEIVKKVNYGNTPDPIYLDELDWGTECFANTYFMEVDANFKNLCDGTSMFYNCAFLLNFKSPNLSRLTTAPYMFADCEALEDFDAKLPRLKEGEAMFRSCQLNERSVLNILTSIPEYKEGEHNLGLGRNINFKNSKQIASLLGTSAPIQSGKYNYKGWTIDISD